MDDERTKNVTKEKTDAAKNRVSQHEDAILKTMMNFFAEELLPYFGIQGKATVVLPTESIHLELRKLYEDFNFRMEDGRIVHFEFQSRNGGVPDLRRFRLYEAVLGDQYQSAVVTYVLYSGNIRDPVTELAEGVNTYRVIPVIMREDDAGQLIEALQKKRKNGQPVTREELIRLALCPLMGGSLSQKERILRAFEITKEATGVSQEELRKIEAVIYAMADKFLDSADMEQVKETVKMTRLGKMVYEDGVQVGMKTGLQTGIQQGIQSALRLLKEFGQSRSAAEKRISHEFSLTEEEARRYIEEYWK